MSKKKNTRNRTYTRRRRNNSQNSAPIGWLLGGIIIGLIIPGVFYLKSHSADTSNNVNDTAVISHREEPLKVKQAVKHHAAAKENAIKQSHYEFYNLLSSQEENTPTNENQPEEKILHISKFQLQIGKFTDFAKADELKAQLSLIGMDNISITKSTQNPHLFKVTAGPYPSRSQASKAQQVLKDNLIESVLITG